MLFTAITCFCARNYFKPENFRWIWIERVQSGDYLHIFNQYRKLGSLKKWMELNWFFVELDILSENVGEIHFIFTTYHMVHG